MFVLTIFEVSLKTCFGFICFRTGLLNKSLSLLVSIMTWEFYLKPDLGNSHPSCHDVGWDSKYISQQQSYLQLIRSWLGMRKFPLCRKHVSPVNNRMDGLNMGLREHNHFQAIFMFQLNNMSWFYLENRFGLHLDTPSLTDVILKRKETSPTGQQSRAKLHTTTQLHNTQLHTT